MVDVGDLINRMAGEEEAFLNSSFLAPVVKGSQVRTRIAGVVVSFSLIGDFEGWALMKPLNWKKAAVVREATFEEIDRYCALFPRVKMILARRRKECWLAHPVNYADAARRFGWRKGEFVPVFLAAGVEQFEQVICRFDGANLWFENVEPGRDPFVAENLRQAFDERIPLGEIKIATLTPEEKISYVFTTGLELRIYRDHTRDRLEDALKHADADLVSYMDQGDTLLVKYVVDGEEFSSSVLKNDLTVMSAGICLDGEDRKFDLTSLVSVLREGSRRHDLHRTDGEYHEW